MNADGGDSLMSLFEAFLAEPTAERFLALRDVVSALPDYEPYGPWLSDAWELFDAGRFEAARDYLQSLMPNWLLSPRAHALLSFAHSKAGHSAKAKAEMWVSAQLLESILSTGDGSEERPYLVLQTADEYHVLEHLGKTAQQQSLVPKGESLCYDKQACADGDVVWFDVSPLFASLARKQAQPS